MTAWVLAVIGGALVAALMYLLRETGSPAQLGPAVALRAVALALVAALLLDAPSGGARVPPPLVALDVSSSWLRGGDSTAWKTARDRARSMSRDSLFVFGDSLRPGAAPDGPHDLASRVQSLAERASGAGRPLIIITDGELDDAAAAREFPAGSRVEVIARRPVVDVGAISIDAPRAAVTGDTIDVRVSLRNGALASGEGSLVLLLGAKTLATVRSDSLAARAERTVTLRVPLGAVEGATTLAAAVTTPGDAEPRNDTVAVPIDVSRAAGAVLVSTSPDYDARFLIPVLRGAVSLPTHAYFRVAPGVWRSEGALGAVSEADVRRAVREAPLAILHGDTALFGAPRDATSGALALLASAGDAAEESYPMGAPPSPIAGALSGIAWDSLPPLDASPQRVSGDWEGLTAARGRQFDRRAVIAGTERGRRVVVAGASGFWRWRFRGGSAGDAYAALWGSVFDWLAAERTDVRAAVPADGLVRAGERIRWRRGAKADTLVVARLSRRGATSTDSLTLRFGRDLGITESEPLAPGVYDVRVPGGQSVLVVNPSRELLPRAAVIAAGPTGGVAIAGDRPRLRDHGWAYLLVLVALCGEWVVRRRSGLR
ncbi:MAG: hypothetical protein ABJD07_07675 [Gemmatimonadaceae bacterium]